MPKTKLAKVMQERHVSAAELVRRSGVNETTIRGAIAGTRKPDSVNRARIATALRVSSEIIF